MYTALPLQTERLFPRIEPMTYKPQWDSFCCCAKSALQVTNFTVLYKIAQSIHFKSTIKKRSRILHLRDRYNHKHLLSLNIKID